MAKKITDLAAAAAIKGDELLELVQGGANVKALAGALLPPGYIDGLKLVYVGPKALTVRSGSAYIQGLARVLFSPADIALTGIAFAASTWYHVYLYLNVAALAIEVVTTAPTAQYNGTARSKTGDPSRRWLGRVRTDASGNLLPFQQADLRITYLQQNNIAPYRVLASGTAVTNANIDLSTVVPAEATLAQVHFSSDSTAALYLRPSNITDGFFCAMTPGQTAYADFPLNGSTTIQYYNGGPPAGGAFLDVVGYVYER